MFSHGIRGLAKTVLAAWLLAALPQACAAPASDAPELILTGGQIYPLGADDQPVAALAIHGDTILALGDDRDVLALAGPYTQQMRLEDSVVLPGAADAWIDLETLGRWDESSLDLRLASTVEEVQAMVRNAAGASRTPDGWLVGWGWSENEWPRAALPRRQDLDATGVEAPIVLWRRAGRLAWLNSAALARLAPLPDEGPPGGRIGRDAEGNPDGILAGTAVDLLGAVVADPDPAARREWIAAGLRHAAASGLTRVATSPVDAAVVTHLLDLEARGLLPVRTDVRLRPAAVAGVGGRRISRRLAESRLVRLAAVGLRLDGPLSARLAALAAPYEGSAGDTGLLMVDAAEITAAMEIARSGGLPLHLQASGDRAIATALAALGPAPPPGTMFIGFDLPPEGGIAAAAAAGAGVAIAAARFAEDIYSLDRLLGPQRAERAHPWAALAAAGVPLTFASDAPSHGLRPLAAVAAAISRQDADGYPAGGWHPEQALERSLLVRGMVGAPHGRRLAALQVGSPADVTVWSEDPVAGTAQGLLRGEALLTIVAGRVAFSRPLVQLEMNGAASR
jgi:predicted amidohydrolase YtcJ